MKRERKPTKREQASERGEKVVVRREISHVSSPAYPEGGRLAGGRKMLAWVL